MASLIGFDKNRQNLEFKGHSKLSINFMSNYLYVEPENEEYKLIFASFEWNYVMKKNLLFVFAEFDFLDFCLVFKNEQICKKIIDYITPKKKNDTTKELPIDTSFVIPIFQKIAENSSVNYHLIETIAKWHQHLNDVNKEKYLNLMKEYQIFDVIIAADEMSQQAKNESKIKRKRKFCEIKKEKMLENALKIEHVSKNNSKFTKIIPITQCQLMCTIQSIRRKLIVFNSNGTFFEYKKRQKRKEFRCIKCEDLAIIDVNESGEVCVKMEEKKHSCEQSTEIPENYQRIKIIQKPDYEIFANCPGYSKKVLVVFDDIDKNYCYEYSWRKNIPYFMCRGCYNQKMGCAVKPRAKVFNEGTKKEYVEVADGHHQCQKRAFKLENFQPIYDCVFEPNFQIEKFCINGKEGKRLIIFDQNDRSKCYRYFFISAKDAFRCLDCKKKRNYVLAKLRLNSEGKEYVILSNVKHVCEKQNYKIVQKNQSHFDYVLKPDFEIQKFCHNGKEGQRLIIFDQHDRTKCYRYCYELKSKKFLCQGCRQYKKYVSAQLRQNCENKEYVVLSNTKHVCVMKNYISNIKMTFHSPEFEFVKETKDGNPKIFMFLENDRNLCFIFAKTYGLYSCLGCKSIKNMPIREKTAKTVTGKLIKDEKTGEYSFQMKPNQVHCCEPKKYQPEKFQISPKIYDLFFYRPKNKPDSLMLAIKHPEKKDSCFTFAYEKSSNRFYCGKCSYLKSSLHVRAQFKKDVDGNEHFEHDSRLHICQPTKLTIISSPKFVFVKEHGLTYYEPKPRVKIDESKVVRMPNFELRPNKDGVPDRKLIIFYPTDKSLCYEYVFESTHQFYKCNKCRSTKTHVVAKLHKDEKNDEIFIVMGNNDHVCKPQKYLPQ